MTDELSMSQLASKEDYWKARCEAAESDAERYRWLRDNGKLKTWEGLTYWTKDERTFETAIDTAIEKERGNV